MKQINTMGCQDGRGGSPVENLSAKMVVERKHHLSQKLQTFTKIGFLKQLGLQLSCILR